MTPALSEPETIGVIEYVCWREIEKIAQCYAPSIIEGSPPVPKSPLHDANGNIVPEPKSPNPYCPTNALK